MTRLEVVPLPSAREVAAGDDLTALVLDACDGAGVTLQDGDVLCVAQKVVSKAEGAVVDAPPGDDVRQTRREVALGQAVRVVADSPWVLVVETRHGLVCANAGVDASNLPAGQLALLPEDPDASAAQLRDALHDATGATVGVLVTDTFGRPWRLGQTEVAIGAAGVQVIRDERGGHDRFGHELEVTEAAVADELAGAADLVRSKADGTPFVLVRGAGLAGTGTGADLVRPAEQDLFRVAGPRAVLRGLRDDPIGDPAPRDVVQAMVQEAARCLPPERGAHLRLRVVAAGVAVLETDRDDLGFEAGTMVAAARIAARTSGWTARWEPLAVEAGDGWRALGRIHVGRVVPGASDGR